MAEWSAEIVVDEALARQLLAQFPELEGSSLEPLAEGWDRTVWLVDRRWVFGFPRRQMVVPGVERELAVLSRLAPLLPLPIPMPVFVGRPAEGYPWPFFGSALLPGREACDVPLDDPARAAVGSQLALFLKRLHSAEVAEEARAHELPVDVVRRADMGYRVPKTRAQLKELAELGLWQAPPHVGELLEAALRLPPATPSGIAHGDLHFRHLLLDGDARLTGVIDWIDVCRADPAIDLQLLWSFVPPSGRRSFLEAYGPATEPQLLRARVLALFLCGSLARYGHAEGATSVEREALGGLDRAVAD